jgi:hypothetical protein
MLAKAIPNQPPEKPRRPRYAGKSTWIMTTCAFDRLPSVKFLLKKKSHPSTSPAAPGHATQSTAKPRRPRHVLRPQFRPQSLAPPHLAPATRVLRHVPASRVRASSGGPEFLGAPRSGDA